MGDQGISGDIKKQLTKLVEKYEAMGQDLSSYLDGLIYSDYLTNWDYIHLDTLLSLQSPRTPIPDERIFYPDLWSEEELRDWGQKFRFELANTNA